MAFAIEGFATVAQNHISRQIASNFYSKAPWLALLGALTLGNQKRDSLEIGRPNSGEILTGGSVSPIERKRLGTVNAYLPRIQKFETNNTRHMAVRDTMPTVANPTTESHGQAMQAAAEFRWTELITPILIWHEDKLRAGQEGTKEGQAIAMGQLVDEATEVAYQEHINALVTDIWSGNPTSQDADLWDAALGILQAQDTANTYARVDRSDAANAVWRSQKDTTTTAVDINRILDDAMLDKGLNIKGTGANLVITNTTLYKSFKHQILNTGGVVMQNGMPEMAKLGVRKEILQKDNTFVMYDPSCPANTVLVQDLTTWKFMVHPQRNFLVTKFVDLTEQGEGQKDADQAFIRTRFMLTCDNPFLNVRYTAIGT